MKSKENTRRGFTLIELLVVVLIIGILAAVAVPQYQKAVEKSRLTEALVNIPVMMREMEAYVLANGYVSHVEYQDIANVEITGVTMEEDPTNEGETLIYSKYFDYSSAITDSYYGVTLYRYQGAREDTDYLYALNVTHYANGTEEKSCYTHFTDIGNYVCNLLSSQGWTKEESVY